MSGSSSSTSIAIPSNAAVLNSDGTISQSWSQFLQKILTKLTTLGSSATWAIGDYRQTSTTLAPPWLLCDGSTFNTTTYPNLAAILDSITAPGGTSGTQFLPGISAVYDPAHPSSNPVLRTWILGG